MKLKTLLALALAGASVLTVRADFFDNFDSYANQAALLASWNATTPTGTGLQLSQSSPTPVSAPNDVKVTSSASYRLVKGFSPVQGNVLDWSFDLFDGGGSRDACSLYSYTGAWGAGLNTTVQMGVFNTGVGNKYMARYSAITGAVYGDGAVATTGDAGTGGWFSLTGAANRATGQWHTMEVLGMDDPSNVGKLRLEFYVDGALGGSLGNINSYAFNFATLGIAVSTTGTGGSAFDNFSVATVPEPSALALSILGGLALAVGRISRRKV